MSPKAADHIRAEHRNMGKVLAALRDHAEALTLKDLSASRLDLLYRMLYYIRVFPNRSHHPKEEDYLFPALRRRAPEMGNELDGLRAEHLQQDTALKELESLFAKLQGDRDQASLVKFQAEVMRFVISEFEHMRHEEDSILPAAERSLTAGDWAKIDKAFSENRDPVFNDEVAFGFEVLRKVLLKAT